MADRLQQPANCPGLVSRGQPAPPRGRGAALGLTPHISEGLTYLAGNFLHGGKWDDLYTRWDAPLLAWSSNSRHATGATVVTWFFPGAMGRIRPAALTSAYGRYPRRGSARDGSIPGFPWPPPAGKQCFFSARALRENTSGRNGTEDRSQRLAGDFQLLAAPCRTRASQRPADGPRRRFHARTCRLAAPTRMADEVRATGARPSIQGWRRPDGGPHFVNWSAPGAIEHTCGEARWESFRIAGPETGYSGQGRHGRDVLNITAKAFGRVTVPNVTPAPPQQSRGQHRRQRNLAWQPHARPCLA